MIQNHKGYAAETPSSIGGLQKWTNHSHPQVLISSISVPRTEAGGGKGGGKYYMRVDTTGPAEAL